MYKLKIALLILFLSPFIIISFFNQPAIDDFWNANTIHEYGRLGAVYHFYQVVSGRYFSNFLMSAFNTLPNYNVIVFKVWPILTIFLLLSSFIFFYKTILKGFLNKKEIILASFVFISVYIVNMPRLFECLYWMSAAVCYQIAITIFVIGIATLIKQFKKNVYSLIAVSCSLLLPGTAETIAPVYLFVILIIFYVALKQKHSLSGIIICVISALCGILLVAVCKGNHLRISHDSAIHQQIFFIALFTSISSAGYYFIVWIINPVNIAATILILPIIQRIIINTKSTLGSVISVNKLFIITLLGYLLCSIIYFPLNYFESDLPFPRITMLVFFVASHLFLIILFLFLVNFGWLYDFIFKIFKIKNFKLFSWVFFFAAIFSSRNFTKVTKDLFNGNAYYYNREANARFHYLKTCKSDTCYVSYFKHWPSSIQNFEKEQDNTDPFNHLEKYFGKTILYKTDK